MRRSWDAANTRPPPRATPPTAASVMSGSAAQRSRRSPWAVASGSASRGGQGAGPLRALPAGNGPPPPGLPRAEPPRDGEEAAVGNGRELLDGDILRANPEALRHIFRRLHVEGLDVHHPAGDLAVRPDLLPQLDLGHLPVRVLEDELMALGLEQRREERPVAALAARARHQVAEADVIGHLGLHALDAGVEELDVLRRLARHDGRRRLVDLDVVSACLHQRFQFPVHRWRQVPAEREAGLVLAGPRTDMDVDREGPGSWNRPPGRLVGLGLEI